MAMPKLLLSLLLLLLLLLLPLLALAAVSEIIDNPSDPTNPRIVVTSSRWETTFDGNVNLNGSGRLQLYRFNSVYKSGETACYYQPVLPMRNFTAAAILNNYWDLEMKLNLYNSEGELLASEQATKKKMHALVSLTVQSPSTADIFEICFVNEGSSKKVQHSVLLMSEDFNSVMKNYFNFTEEQRLLTQRMDRLNGFLAKVKIFDDEFVAVLTQDFFRMQNIKGWLDKDGVLGCLAILLSSFLSTAIVKRWFKDVGGGA